MPRDIDIGFPSSGNIAHITDAKVNYTAGNLDTEAEIITAINAANTTLNLALAALENSGLVKKS